MQHVVGARRRIRGGAVTVLVTALLTLGTAPAGAGGVADGMLETDDVGLPVLSEPHASTVAAVDLVDPDTCASAPTEEREAWVVSFAKDPDSPSSGAQLNEIVVDLSSAAEAKAAFAEVRMSEQARAECGSTEKATNITFAKGPKKVGAARFTVTASERISGTTRKVVSVTLLQGAHVAHVNFIDWGGGLPAIAKVAKRAADRLS